MNFDYYNPTKVVFGKEIYNRIPEEIAIHYSQKKIMLTYGGGSIKENGILDQLKLALAGYDVTYFGGIEANPEYDTLMKAVQIIKEKGIGFVLAVGGGSVIDGTKFITAAVSYQGSTPWDVLVRKEGCVFHDAIPFGTVLTLPATGSEMNSGAVISNSRLKEKRTMGGPQSFPKFSFLNPLVVASLPEKQLANGVIDAFMHTLEQYLTFPTWNLLQERIAEGILATLLEVGPKVIKHPSDDELAANLMWCATMALNGTLRAGVVYDWSTHMIAHELTALHGIDHARTLAIVAPELYRMQLEQKREKLNQCGQRIFGLKGDCATDTIDRIEDFFNSLQVPTRLREYITELGDTDEIIATRFKERGWLEMGENGDITPEKAARIIRNAF
jgi:NADP-dependent alcohol dehydrogenase